MRRVDLFFHLRLLLEPIFPNTNYDNHVHLSVKQLVKQQVKESVNRHILRIIGNSFESLAKALCVSEASDRDE